jgi:hypothetical protein
LDRRGRPAAARARPHRSPHRLDVDVRVAGLADVGVRWCAHPGRRAHRRLSLAVSGPG